MIKRMKTFTALHTHRFGTSIYLFQSKSNWTHKTSDANLAVLVEALDIDYEPDREESIEIIAVNLADLPTLP